MLARIMNKIQINKYYNNSNIVISNKIISYCHTRNFELKHTQLNFKNYCSYKISNF